MQNQLSPFHSGLGPPGIQHKSASPQAFPCPCFLLETGNWPLKTVFALAFVIHFIIEYSLLNIEYSLLTLTFAFVFLLFFCFLFFYTLPLTPYPLKRPLHLTPSSPLTLLFYWKLSSHHARTMSSRHALSRDPA
jgi:hypothetical protein